MATSSLSSSHTNATDDKSKKDEALDVSAGPQDLSSSSSDASPGDSDSNNVSHDVEKGVATSTAAATTAADPSTSPDKEAAAEASEANAEVDGGTRAWLQVVGSFLVFGNLWGLTFAFGSFQSYYHLTYIPSESASDISWIGTVSIFLLIFGGVISGPLFDRGYFRSMLLAGAFIETLGLFLMSLCKTYWQLFLTQAVVMGLGSGLLYIPGLTLVGRSFKKHRSIAMSITTCGAPVGGIIYTLMFEQLIDRIGFGSTVRAMGYFMLGTYCISFPLSLWGVRNLGSVGEKSEKRKLFDVTALTDLPFLLFSWSQFFIFLGYMVPFIYIPTYGQVQLGFSQSFSLTIVIISQAASIVGRLIAGYTAKQIGVMIPWIISAVCSGIFCLAWIGAATSETTYIVIAVLYGGFSGALIPLPPSIFPVVCQDPKTLGTRLGMAQSFSALGSLTGAPIAGALIGVAGQHGMGRFLGLQLFGGLAMGLGGAGLVWLWVLLIRRRGLGKFI